MSERPAIEHREEPDLNKIWDLLLEVNTKLTNHITEEAAWKPELLKVIDLFRQSRGAVTFIKYTAIIGATLAGAWGFFTAHWTWKG